MMGENCVSTTTKCKGASQKTFNGSFIDCSCDRKRISRLLLLPSGQWLGFNYRAVSTQSPSTTWSCCWLYLIVGLGHLHGAGEQSLFSFFLLFLFLIRLSIENLSLFSIVYLVLFDFWHRSSVFFFLLLCLLSVVLEIGKCNVKCP